MRRRLSGSATVRLTSFTGRALADSTYILQRCRVFLIATLLGATCASAVPPKSWPSGRDLSPVFNAAVTRRLAIPADEAATYAQHLDAALTGAGVALAHPQYVLLVDRSPQVQAIFVYWRDEQGGWHLIGATPVSTGSCGGFEHFITPLGVFAHTTAHPDFRAEGTGQRVRRAWLRRQGHARCSTLAGYRPNVPGAAAA
jgi:hypothetical protein